MGHGSHALPSLSDPSNIGDGGLRKLFTLFISCVFKHLLRDSKEHSANCGAGNNKRDKQNGEKEHIHDEPRAPFYTFTGHKEQREPLRQSCFSHGIVKNQTECEEGSHAMSPGLCQDTVCRLDSRSGQHVETNNAGPTDTHNRPPIYGHEKDADNADPLLCEGIRAGAYKCKEYPNQKTNDKVSFIFAAH